MKIRPVQGELFLAEKQTVTEGHDGTNIHFSQFCEPTSKWTF